MDILIIANFCGRLDGKDNNRFIYLAELLKNKHNVEVLTSDFNHLTKKTRQYKKEEKGYKITQLHEIGYPKNISVKRFYSHYLWGKEVEKYLKRRKKPDVVYCAVPSLNGPNKVAKHCERNGIRFIIDIQDLWPEAFQMIMNFPIVSKVIFSPFRFWANGIYKRADEIVAVSNSYVDRALKVNKKCNSGHVVFLGTELDEFDRNANSEVDLIKEQDELWLGYCGTLGSSYDLTCVIDALNLLNGNGVMVPKFIVMGDGPRRKEFETYAKKKSVDCIFTGMLPYNHMCALLVRCDLVVNPIRHGAAQSIINKHADYAASGLPVINTQECEEYRDLVINYNMGVNCENNDYNDLADKLKMLIIDKDKRIMMGKNARKCAERCFDRKQSYNELQKIIEKNV